MGLTFEWDTAKADANERKHGLSFAEAATAFGDPLSITIADPDHSEREDRFVLIGATYLGRIVVAIHAERGDNIRIISARFAARSERKTYGREDR